MSDLRQLAFRYLQQLAEGEPQIILALRPSPSSAEAQYRVDKGRLLEEIATQASACVRCPHLAKGRRNVVFGVGSAQARLMFIGEAPGADEDRLGEPFVGRAGKLLDKILEAMKIKREEVYIANILKCRPPDNRNPFLNEAENCLPYLRRQIEIIQPSLIVALGLVAAEHLLGMPPGSTIKSLRGRIFNYCRIPVIITYHPAALLRNPQYKTPTWEDMQTAMQLLCGEIRWSPPPETDHSQQQEGLFEG